MLWIYANEDETRLPALKLMASVSRRGTGNILLYQEIAKNPVLLDQNLATLVQDLKKETTVGFSLPHLILHTSVLSTHLHKARIPMTFRRMKLFRLILATCRRQFCRGYEAVDDTLEVRDHLFTAAVPYVLYVVPEVDVLAK